MLNRIRNIPTRPLAVILIVAMVAFGFIGLAIAKHNHDDGRQATTQRELSEQPAATPGASDVSPGQSQAQGGNDPLPPLPQTKKEARRTKRQDQAHQQFNAGAEEQAKRWPSLQAVPYRRAGVLIDRLDVDPKDSRYLRLLVISTLSEPEARKVYDQFLRGNKDKGRWYKIAFVTPGHAKELGYVDG